MAITFSNLNSNCSDLLDLRDLQEQVKKKHSVIKNCSEFSLNFSSDLKFFANFEPSALKFKSFSQSIEYYFLTVGQTNFGNKI